KRIPEKSNDSWYRCIRIKGLSKRSGSRRSGGLEGCLKMIVLANIEYDQGHEIGSGHYGKVYRSTDPQLGGAVLAVKVIPKTKLLDPTNFWAESQTMHKATHDNVVPVRYACQTSTNIILAMPYYSKGSLADKIAANPVSTLEAIRIGRGMLSGISQVHN